MNKLIDISSLSKMLGLIDPISKKPQNHILRYWEKEFKQIKPKKINNRRYYTNKQIKIVKIIKFLLKNEGVTISGVKKILKNKINNLDDSSNVSLKNNYYKNYIKTKSKQILDKLEKIKSYGKKNSS